MLYLNCADCTIETIALNVIQYSVTILLKEVAKMVLTPAQKRAHDKYDQANYTNLAIRIRKTYAQEIREACKSDGITPASIMRSAIDAYMKEYRRRSEDK